MVLDPLINKYLGVNNEKKQYLSTNIDEFTNLFVILIENYCLAYMANQCLLILIILGNKNCLYLLFIPNILDISLTLFLHIRLDNIAKVISILEYLKYLILNA